VVLGGAVDDWVVASEVGGAVVAGSVVGGAVLGGAVVGASVVAGSVVAGSVVGGPVESGGSWASAARRLADPASSRPTVATATTTTRSERLAVASSRRRPPGTRRCPGSGRSLNSSLLKTANFPTQRIPNASREAAITTAVVVAREAPALPATVLAAPAAQVDRARPRNAITQNGTTSLQRWERPRRPQAQVRLR
jgi:hypothetical protein